MTPKSALNPYRPLSGLRVFLLAALLVGWGAVHAETNLDDLVSEGIEKIKQEKATKEAAETEKLKQAEEAKREAEKEVADKAAAEKKEQAEAERKAASSAKAEPYTTTEKPAKTKKTNNQNEILFYYLSTSSNHCWTLPLFSMKKDNTFILDLWVEPSEDDDSGLVYRYQGAWEDVFGHYQFTFNDKFPLMDETHYFTNVDVIGATCKITFSA